LLNKRISVGGVEVWCGELDADEAQLAYFASLLDVAEREKAARFATPLLRARYTETHGRLRCLLAEYCHCPPQALQFAEGSHGKPYLPAFPEIAFNQSHSQDWQAVAVGQGRGYRVGVDIEVWRERMELSSIVSRYFAVGERQYWEDLPETQRQEAFYALWTQKEAFVKAVGRGIALGLERCVVATDGDARLIAVPEGCGEAADWRVAALALGENISGAVVLNSSVA
jgi:4'-phosphopantetheinyl transferase